MTKQILSIGFVIPWFSEDFISFNSRKSLMDADILVISPKWISPSWNWVSFTSGWGGCYDVTTSNHYQKWISHYKKEIEDLLNSWKTIFIILAKKEDFVLANSVSSPRKNENTYNTSYWNNYEFLPINVGKLVSASWKHIEFSGESTMNPFYKGFKDYLEYQLYIENIENATITFTGKDKTKTLGAIYDHHNWGHIVFLPYINFNKDSFQEFNSEDNKYYWTDEAIQFWHKLTSCLIQIDKQLTQKSEKTPMPDWAKKEKFSSKVSLKISAEILNTEKKIESLKEKIIKLNIDLENENILKDLLFEQWKPLENAVIKALRILGFEADNYDDGELELDQVIISPEGYRYIGECEGKDNKDIDISKFRQLLESLNADFDRAEVEEKAFWILFWNPQRLESPDIRTLDFTKKCKTWAEREIIALIRTVDLFNVVRYLSENKNEKYKLACRNAIYQGLGNIIQFPELPKL